MFFDETIEMIYRDNDLDLLERQCGKLSVK